MLAANVDGNITLGKLDYRRAVYICTQYLISHTFSTNCDHVLEKETETIHSQYKYAFLQSGPHMMNFKLLLQLYHKDTTFDREIKRRIRMKT
jgi:hypothetical protein